MISIMVPIKAIQNSYRIYLFMFDFSHITKTKNQIIAIFIVHAIENTFQNPIHHHILYAPMTSQIILR
ncbi:MAG: hypothetical protein WCG25_08085 [bacterium]